MKRTEPALTPLLLATANQHKVEEIREILCHVPFRLLTLADFPAIEAPLEDGATFEENSLLKARAYCRDAGVAALADDSGLEIAYLKGEPGIHSARYFGASVPFAEKNRRILAMMEDVPDSRRAARFVCHATLAYPDGRIFASRGVCRGRIARDMRGARGFGYDPIFFIPSRGVTMAQLDSAEKNRISHRARALRGIRRFLEARA